MQVGEVFGAGDFDRAQPFRGFRYHLRVEEAEAAFAQALHQMKERDLGGVGLVMEHGFPGKEAADRDAVDAPHQFVSAPAFRAVRVTGFVQPGVGGDEFRPDPGSRPRGFGAALHYLGEITGEITTDDLLANIFSKFCIGK